MQLSIKIKIAFDRKEIGPFSISVSTAEEIFSAIKHKLAEYGLTDIDEENFYTYEKTKLNKENIISSISDNVLFVLYNNIAAPYGAYEYGREDGMVFFFHTSEKPHKYFPHIHVRYSGEVMSIYLSNLKIEGGFSNKKMEKRAIEYVKIHKKDIFDKWNMIIQ